MITICIVVGTWIGVSAIFYQRDIREYYVSGGLKRLSERTHTNWNAIALVKNLTEWKRNTKEDDDIKEVMQEIEMLKVQKEKLELLEELKVEKGQLENYIERKSKGRRNDEYYHGW